MTRGRLFSVKNAGQLNLSFANTYKAPLFPLKKDIEELFKPLDE
jgi:hypothetical protein